MEMNFATTFCENHDVGPYGAPLGMHTIQPLHCEMQVRSIFPDLYIRNLG